MTDYPISHDKQVKNFARDRGRKPKYPFKLMAIGDSFPFALEEYDRVLWAMMQCQLRSNHLKKFHISRADLIVARIK
jgi:hypothetical protein